MKNTTIHYLVLEQLDLVLQGMVLHVEGVAVGEAVLEVTQRVGRLVRLLVQLDLRKRGHLKPNDPRTPLETLTRALVSDSRMPSFSRYFLNSSLLVSMGADLTEVDMVTGEEETRARGKMISRNSREIK